jgi:hypothetical protein
MGSEAKKQGCRQFRNRKIANDEYSLAMAVKLSPLSVITPALYLTLGYLSLAYFKVAYGLFTRLVSLHLGIPVFDTIIQPMLEQVLTLMQQSIGSADQLRFSMTNILLAAILIVLSN